METKIGRGLRVSTALIGMICGSAAAAQLAPNSGADFPRPKIQTATCTEVMWSHNLSARYPRIGEACHEVFFSEGRKWARFQADFVQLDRDGRITLDFKDRYERQLERITVLPAMSQSWAMEGRVYTPRDLVRGQVLNVYLPEETFAAALDLSAPFDGLEEIVLSKFVPH
jgi:hypothetical protein